MNKLLVHLITLFILSGCNVSQNIKIEKISITLKDEANINAEKKFIEITPKKLHKQKNEVLIFLVSHSFYNDTVLINRRDTLMFNKKLPNDCGLKAYVINKKGRYFRISTNKNKEVKIKNIKDYDYIVIRKFINNEWLISYYPFFPILNCI